jgi:stage III sporulation protein AG
MEKVTQIVNKYKFAALILLVGLLLMSLPDWKEKTSDTVMPAYREEPQSLTLQIEEILSQIDGVGQAKVLLTESSGPTTWYQMDTDSQTANDSETLRTETVIISNSERTEEGLVSRKDPPVYMGAIVVCQGAERSSVQLAVIEAVSNVTGIRTDRITVLKMK